MKQVQDKSGRILFKLGRKIQAFAWESKTQGKGWCYAFGKPSGNYLAFSGNNTPLTREQATQRIKESL